MLDIDSLFTAIVSTVNATGSLSSMSGKCFMDFVPEQLPDGTKVARPYCQFAVVGDSTQSVYGKTFLDSVRVRFSIYADSLTTANSLSKALKSAFHGTTLTLSSGISVGSSRLAGDLIRVSRKLPDQMVYNAITNMEFQVQS